MGRLWFAVFALLSVAYADVYLHFPPGSNNRVNEPTATRKNDNNAFDSQNNERGGYNVPDATKTAAGTNAGLQYYYVSHKLNKSIHSLDSKIIFDVKRMISREV